MSSPPRIPLLLLFFGFFFLVLVAPPKKGARNAFVLLFPLEFSHVYRKGSEKWNFQDKTILQLFTAMYTTVTSSEVFCSLVEMVTS